MSLQEVLEYELGKLKTITVDEIIIVNDPIQPRNGITLAYFNANLPSGGGNMDFVGTSPLIGQHYMTDSTTGETAIKSSIVEDNVSLSFDSKDLILIGDVTADKYVVNGGLATQLLAGDGSLVNISSIPAGNMVYTPVSGNIGSHYQQSSLDGQNCIESNLSEDTFNFYFGNRNIQDISYANVAGVNATNQVSVGSLSSANSVLKPSGLTIQNNTTINTSKLTINELTIKDATSTTFYQARNIIDANSLTLTTPTITTNGNITANSYAIPGGTNQFVLLADGSIAPYNSGGGQGNIFLYQNDTDITVPPSASGHIQYNNLVQPSATIVYINHLTQDGIDIDPFLSEIRPNDILYIQDKNLSTNYIKYSVVSTVIIPNNYIAITVTFIEAEGTGLTTFGNNHPIFFTVFINNTLINQRLDALETKTRYQSSATTNQTTFVNTLNTDIINANHIYQIGGGEYITDTYADAKYLQIINEANPLPITLTSTGSGTSLLNSTTNPSFTTKSLGVSTGLSIASTSTDITLTNSSPASAISVSDAGSNLSLIGSTSANPAFTFKTLSASTGITINDITNNLQIVNNSPATIITCNDAATGISLLGSNTNPNFTFKTLVAGTDITIGDVANQLTISSTAGSSVNLTNGGANLSLVASTSANPNLKTKSVSASTGITINDVSNNLQIVNSSPASGISIASSGTGFTLWKTLSNPSFVSKGLLEGTATSFTITSDSITINNTSPASAITLSNSGSGTSILNSTTNPTFTTKSLTAGTNVNFVGSSASDITINADASTLASAGSGTSLVVSGTAPSLSVKSLSNGTGITFSDVSSNIQITNSSPASGITLSNVGANLSLLASTSANPSFKTKSVSASTGITINDVSDNLEIVNSSPASAISLTNDGVGTYSLIGSTSVNPSFKNKTVSVGTGITINDTSNILTISNSSPASGITLTNDGVGTYSLIGSTSSNPALKNKTMNAGTGITINDSSNILTITNSQPSGNITLTSPGSGTSLLTTSSSNPTFSTKTLTAGTNITFTTTADDIKIDATGGSGGTYTFTNGGTGTTLVSTASTSTDFKPVSITAGANVTITPSGTNIVIASAGASGTNTINAVLESASPSTFYPTFVNGAGTKTALNYDTGFSYIPSTKALSLSACFASGKYTSALALTSIAFEGLARTSQKITTTDGSAFTSTYYPCFVPLSTSSNEQSVNTDSGLSYIPSTNTLTVQNHNGTLFTATTSSPTVGFVGHASSAAQVLTTDGSLFTSTYYVTFVPISSASPSQTVSTDSALSYVPSTNTLGLLATTNYTGTLYTSSNAALTAGFVGTASRALELAQTSVAGATTTYYPLLSTSALSSTTLNPSEAMGVNSLLSYVPSTNALTATTFVGALTGTAQKATAVVGAGTNNLIVQTATDTTSTTALANGASGTFLQSNGTSSLPSWVASSTLGFQMSFGGKILLTNDYLTPNRFADTNATSVTATSYLTQWRCPVACNITAWSSAVQTTSTATLSILIAGIAGTAIANVATNTVNGGTITARPVGAGVNVEIRIVGLITNATCVTLYFT